MAMESLGSWVLGLGSQPAFLLGDVAGIFKAREFSGSNKTPWPWFARATMSLSKPWRYTFKGKETKMVPNLWALRNWNSSHHSIQGQPSLATMLHNSHPLLPMKELFINHRESKSTARVGQQETRQEGNSHPLRRLNNHPFLQTEWSIALYIVLSLGQPRPLRSGWTVPALDQFSHQDDSSSCLWRC